MAAGLLASIETAAGGTWRLAGCRDYWSKYELGWHVAPTANRHDAIAAVELALTEAARLAGRPLADVVERDEQGNVVPLVCPAPGLMEALVSPLFRGVRLLDLRAT